MGHSRESLTRFPDAGYVPEVDGLRGIAIFLVLVHHFAPHVQNIWVERELHTGWIGVDLFFAVSGFLITGILVRTREDRRYYSNFYVRRALRIFPLYYLLLFILFTLIPRMQGGPYFETAFVGESGSPLWYVFYLGNVREAIVGDGPGYLLAPLWSLSIEEHFYLLFPVVVACLSLRSLRRLLLVLVTTAPLIRFAFLLAFPENERIQYVGTVCRLDGLSLGGLLALATEGKSLASWRRITFFAMIVMLALLATAFATGGLVHTGAFCRVWGYSLVAITAGSVVLYGVANRGCRSTGWLRSSGLCSLGKICYGTYLFHRPVEIGLLKVLAFAGISAPPDAVWLVFAKCGAAIGVAAISWNLFEKPILRFKRYFVSENPAFRPTAIDNALLPYVSDLGQNEAS